MRSLKRHFAWISIGLAASVVLIDKWLKSLVASGSLSLSESWIVITPHFNEGVLGGLFADLHPWIIRIFFSVLFGFIALLTSLFLYFLRHKEVPRLKYGIVLYVSGILGNVWDRAATGRITDFLTLNLPLMRHYALNFADLVLLTGLALIIASFIFDNRLIWFNQNQRRSLIIESRFQFGFSAFLVFMAAMGALIVAIYSFTFLKVYLDPSVTAPAGAEIIRDYLLGLVIIEVGFLLITLGVGLIFSHRMAGPIYAFERYIERIVGKREAGSDPEVFRLRNMDHFKSLEKTAEQILERLRTLK